MDGTTPLGENYREIDIVLVLMKVYNRVPKMRGHNSVPPSCE